MDQYSEKVKRNFSEFGNGDGIIPTKFASVAMPENIWNDIKQGQWKFQKHEMWNCYGRIIIKVDMEVTKDFLRLIYGQKLPVGKINKDGV